MIDPRSGAGNGGDGGIFDDEDSDVGGNQEFERALSAGTEGLQRGDAQEARIALEKALRYKPRNQRARNLLGLSLFKLGELQRAEEIYRALIEDHPADPTLRVNLGLVFLKAGTSTDAARCFETALDLQPDHQKAQNYLGLALAQKGELARAREWFLKAGNQPMAERMAQAIAASPIRQVAEGASKTLDQEKPFKSALDDKAGAKRLEHTMEMARPPSSAPRRTPTPPHGNKWVANAPATPAAPPLTKPGVAPNPEPTPASSPVEALAEATAQAVAIAAEQHLPSALSQYTSSQRLDMPAAGGALFAIGASEVLVHVHGEILTRLDGLVASWGSVSMKPELKRFRGKATDKTFGDGSRRMLRASGEGRFVISREGRSFTALELGDEPAYFREETLFAFEESIVFENGRVPSRSGTDLHLVHLRGRGRLLLVTASDPKAVEVKRGEPLRIPMEQLVGWHGPLIQPRLVPIVEEAPDLGMALELAGEGRALIDVPAGR